MHMSVVKDLLFLFLPACNVPSELKRVAMAKKSYQGKGASMQFLTDYNTMALVMLGIC